MTDHIELADLTARLTVPTCTVEAMAAAASLRPDGRAPLHMVAGGRAHRASGPSEPA